MKYCKIFDCSDCHNKCNDCLHKDICDYVWINKLWRDNAEFLTPNIPIVVKTALRQNRIISHRRENDFTMYSPPSSRKSYVTIQDIAVSEKCRGNHVASDIIKFLMNTYDSDVVAKCIKGSSSELFWSHIGVKIGEELSKKSTVCTYIVTNKNKSKQELFE